MRADTLFLPLLAGHFLGFLTVGLPLPVLPLYVHEILGHGPAVVGLCIGTHFIATIAFRGVAGRLIDTRGSRWATMRGVAAFAVSSLIYLLVALPDIPDGAKLVCILVARLCSGVGQSLLGTGILIWGFGLLGEKYTARVIAWTGVSMYGSIALGAPLGLFFWNAWGIAALGIASFLLCVLSALSFSRLPEAQTAKKQASRNRRAVLRYVLRPGISLALHGVGNASISTFIVLYFSSKSWEHAGWALTSFGLSFIVMRLLSGDLLDRIAVLPPLLASLAAEALGLVLIATASSSGMAFLGVTLTGLGCALVLPGLGVQVAAVAPKEIRGSTMGWFLAFQDISFALTGPLTGMLIPAFGYPSVFFIGAICAVLGLVLLLRRASPE